MQPATVITMRDGEDVWVIAVDGAIGHIGHHGPPCGTASPPPFTIERGDKKWPPDDE